MGVPVCLQALLSFYFHKVIHLLFGSAPENMEHVVGNFVTQWIVQTCFTRSSASTTVALGFLCCVTLKHTCPLAQESFGCSPMHPIMNKGGLPPWTVPNICTQIVCECWAEGVGFRNYAKSCFKCTLCIAKTHIPQAYLHSWMSFKVVSGPSAVHNNNNNMYIEC